MAELITLRPYQQEDLAFIEKRNGRAGIGDEMGLGKTVVALEFLRRTEPQAVLIVCPKAAIGVWQDACERWTEHALMPYAGTADKRAQINVHVRGWYIVNYTMMRELSTRRQRWDAIIYDESHRLSNRKTKTFKAANSMHSKYLLCLSGGPIVNGPQDLWGPIHLMDSTHRSYWKWLEQYFHLQRGVYGTEIGEPKDRRAFNQHVRTYWIRHRKTQVLTQLPPKERQIIPLTMTDIQQRLYTQIAEDLLAVWDDTIVLTPNTLAQMVRLRQMLVTPALLGFPHESAAFQALEEMLDDNRDPAVIFTAFPSCFPFLRIMCEQLQIRTYAISAKTNATQTAAAWRGFQQDSGRRVLLCGVKSAVAFSATAAPRAYFLGYHWTPEANYQAEDRLWRDGQQNPVHILYLLYAGTVDDVVADALHQKNNWMGKAFGKQDLLIPKRRHGALVPAGGKA